MYQGTGCMPWNVERRCERALENAKTDGIALEDCVLWRELPYNCHFGGNGPWRYLSLAPRVASSWTKPVRVAQREQRRELVISLSQQSGIQHSCLFPGPRLFSNVNVASVAILTTFGKNIQLPIALCNVQKYTIMQNQQKKIFSKNGS